MSDDLPMYLLFAGEFFYPEGGAYDYIGSFYARDTAIEYGQKWLGAYNWWHVAQFDGARLTIVAESSEVPW